MVLITSRVGLQPHRGEEIQQGIVSQVAGHRPKSQQVLQRVLHKKARHNAHGGGQAGRAHPVLLQRALIDVAGHHQRRRAREAGRLAGPQELNVPRHGVLGHARLEPGLAELVAGLVDGHPRLEVVDAAEDEVDGAGGEAARLEAGHEMVEVVDGGDVVVVRLEGHVGVDVGEGHGRRLHLLR